MSQTDPAPSMTSEYASKGFASFVAAMFSLAWINVLFGVILAITYRAGLPHETTVRLRETFPFLVGCHVWMTTILLVAGFAGLAYAVFSRKVVWPNNGTYASLLVLCAVVYGFQITGNLLPGDSHDVRTYVVEGGVFARLPFFGGFAHDAMLAGQGFSQRTFDIAYMVHLALALGLFAPFLIPRFVRQGQLGADLRRTGAWLGGLVLLAFVSATAGGFPTGAPYTTADTTSQEAVASWYALPLHASLRAWDQIGNLGWVGAFVIPGLFALLLLIGRIWAVGRRGRTFQIGFGVFCAYFLVVVLTIGGQPASIVGNQDIASTTQATIDNGVINEALALQGQALFLAKGCGGCHTIDASHGRVGPDLRQVYLRHDRALLKKFIANPSSVKKGSTMPAFSHLTAAELEAIAEYLVKPR